MSDFEPSLEPKEAALKVRGFVKENRAELKRLMASVFPYLLILTVLSIFFDYQIQMDLIEYMKTMDIPKTQQDILAFINHTVSLSYTSVYFYIGFFSKLLIGYCFASIAVSWHRLVLLGHDRYEPMSPLAPTRSELHFILMWTAIGTLLPFLLGVVSGINFWSVVLLAIILPYLTFKISFYFPAKALDSHLSFKQSFHLTNGYFWKSVFLGFRSFWRVTLVFAAIGLLMGAFGGMLARSFYYDDMTSAFIRGAYNQMATQPFQTVITVFFFQPLLTVLGVTVLSNYYQHALRHKSV